MLKLKLQYLATSCKELTHWKRLGCWEGLGAGGEGDDRGWDGWMASLTRWTWVWVNSRSWWWTGRPGVLRFMGLQRVGHDWATELNWTELKSEYTVVSPYLQGIYSKTPSRYLKLQIVLNHIYAMFSPKLRDWWLAGDWVTQSCPTLCDPMDSSLPGSVCGISQAGILGWVAISFSRESSWPRDGTQASCIAGGFFTDRTTQVGVCWAAWDFITLLGMVCSLKLRNCLFLGFCI